MNRFRQRLRTLRAISRGVVWINVFTMVLEDYRVGLVILVIVIELLTSWEVVLEQFITLVFQLFDHISSAVVDLFVRVAINLISVQYLITFAINVIDNSMLNIGIVLNNISNITVTSMVGNGWNFVGISSVALESWTGYNTGLLTGNR